MPDYGWLTTKHDIYLLREEEWRRNERRFRAGMQILQDLTPFDWELCGLPSGDGEYALQRAVENLMTTDSLTNRRGNHYARRQARAVYVNFPKRFAVLMAGHLSKKRPEPGKGLDFGSLGQISGKGESPTFADLVYYNVDGVGQGGAQWDAFWFDVVGWSMVTGHRWVFCEAPDAEVTSEADVFAGKRPYLVHISPLAITNWEFIQGELAWAIQELGPGPAKVIDGKLSRDSRGFRLYVRERIEDLGDEFAGGGWFTFDKNCVLLEATGNWNATKGEIPLSPHFYERDNALMSRSGVTEIGNAGAAVMDLGSAADFDAWDASSSLMYMLGVDPEGAQVAFTQIEGGSRVVAVPPPINKLTGEWSSATPTIMDGSMGAVPATVMKSRLDDIRQTVSDIMSFEASSTPNSSGASKAAGFSEDKSPRLALMATEVETAQNIMILRLEQRFNPNKAPSGSASWPKDFDLAPVMQGISDMVQLQKDAGIKSKTLIVGAVIAGGRDTGQVTDENVKAVQAELEASYDQGQQTTAALQSTLNEFGAGVSNKSTDPAATAPAAAGSAGA